MSTQHAYADVDVFTSASLKGNPLAVVFDADELSAAQMQAFANWTNLSETTFVLKPRDARADYRLRIFTPTTEFQFAGHPTLGTCHAWLERGGKPQNAQLVVQECGIGLVNVHRLQNNRLAFEAPAIKRSEVDAALLQQVLAALKLSAAQVQAAQWLDNGGPAWLCLELDAADTVLRIEPDHAALKRLAKVGVVAAYPDGDACQYEVRAFAAAVGIDEDPVTGSLNASLAHWLFAQGKAPSSYVASQGTRLGRAGRVYVTQRADGVVLIGGNSVTQVSGNLSL
jgi:PhzF family phenazine biosynthesis protein